VEGNPRAAESAGGSGSRLSVVYGYHDVARFASLLDIAMGLGDLFPMDIACR